MAVPMMDVWIVRMLVSHGRVMMPVRVRFAGGIVGPVFVLMVRVVDVPVLVVHRFVLVVVAVGFREVEVKPDCHQYASDHQTCAQGFAQ